MICRSRLKSAAIVLCLLAVVAGAGCRKTAKDPFPPSGVAAGWQKASETRTFAAKDLWQYVDGQAEQYIQAGVVSASTSDYIFHGQLQAVVDVYTMRDAAGAGKILTSDKTGGAKTVSLGDEAIAFEQSVTFRKGPYLVRVLAFEPTPETVPALMALAHTVEARL